MNTSISKWKYWLSHLFEIHIESRESEINTELHLVLSKGRLQLYTENAIYSFEDLYDNFFQTFEKLNLDLLPTDAQVLILGYGMGSIPFMLEKNFKRNFEFTGVELDEEIIDLANTYVIPKLKNRQQLIYGDAKIFLETTEEKYDLIVVDVFIDDLIPTKFEKQDFIELVQESLKPNGLMLYNRLANNNFSKNQVDIFLNDIIKPIFKQAEKIIVDDNQIIYSDKRFLK